MIHFPSGGVLPQEAGRPFPPGPATLWYVGNDFLRLQSLRRDLPDGWGEGAVAERVQGAALTLRDRYRDLDAELGWPEADRDGWDASLIGERNTATTRVLLNAARLVLMEELAQEEGNHLLVSEDVRFVALARRRLGLTLGPALRLKLTFANVLDRFQSWRSTVSSAARMIDRIRYIRRLRRYHPLPWEILRQVEVLLLCWVRPETFAEGFPRRDSHLAELPLLLNDSGHRVGFLGLSMWWATDFSATVKNMADSGVPALVVEDILTPWDAAIAAVRALCLNQRFRRRLRIAIGPLADAARLEISSQTFASVLPYALKDLGERLVRLGICPRVLLHPCENQPWEKTLRTGIRKALPDCRVMAMLHAPFPRIDVCWIASQREIALGRLPDLILAHGSEGMETLAAWGVPEDRLCMAGAWRFADMPEIDPVSSGCEAVLCCTSIHWEETVELTLKAIQATAGIEGVRLVVNFHPVTSPEFRRTARETVGRLADCSMDHVSFSDLGVRDLLADCAVVIYDTSSASFDGAWSGRRMIHVGSEVRLNADTLPEGMACQVVSAHELRQALTVLVDKPQEDNRARLAACVSPASPSALLEHLRPPTS